MSPISAAIVSASTQLIPGTVQSNGTWRWSAPRRRSSRSQSVISRSSSSISRRLASIVACHG
jgi:hypothetical protein